jgi:hypothetical protein
MKKHNHSNVIIKGVESRVKTDVYEEGWVTHFPNKIEVMSGSDLVNEFELITNKKSKLSKSMREKVIEMVKDLYVTV